MSRFKLMGVTTALATALWMGACSSDEPEPNPSFSVGEAGAPAGGQTSVDYGGEPGQPEPGAAGQATGARPGQAGGAPNLGGAPPTTAGAGGAETEQPPYDCVLHPITHLEIINACTDALRIEKHPTLPALPE